MVTCEELMKKGYAKTILKWCPTGRRRECRPRYLLMQEVTTEMREREISNMDRQVRMEKENKTLSTEICENNNTLYINKNFEIHK